VRNWLGQDIVPGSVVYRGARQGNGSDYKVGVVESVDESQGTARVVYKYTLGSTYRITPDRESAWGPVELDSKGSPSINSLIVLSDNDLARLDQARFWMLKWKSDPSMTKAELRAVLDTLI